MFDLENTKYEVHYTNLFKKQYKKILKQGKDKNKFLKVLGILANGLQLEEKYKDHSLVDNKYFNNCRECHITPDWLLVYKYNDKELILFLVDTGSHSEVLDK